MTRAEIGGGTVTCGTEFSSLAYAVSHRPADHVLTVDRQSYQRQARQLLRACRSEARIVAGRHSPELLTPLTLLENGVSSVRVVGASASHFSRPCHSGLDVRGIPHAPLSLVLVDRRAALVSVPERSDSMAVLLRDRSEVSAVLTAFEDVWRRAATSRTPAAPLTPRAAAVLTCLAAGMTDAAIAMRLGLTARTIRREVNSLMQSVGAVSRFQLAVLTRQRGWLTTVS